MKVSSKDKSTLMRAANIRRKKRNLRSVKLAELEVDMRKVQVHTDKIYDTLRTLTPQFQGCKNILIYFKRLALNSSTRTMR